MTTKSKILWLVCLLLLAVNLPDNFSQAQALTHVNGIHAVGIRGGIGTKNKFDVGLTYNYHFNPKIALSLEFDHEQAKFNHSKFCNVILFSPGIDYSPINPWGWSYLTLNLSGSIGYDIWSSDLIDLKQKGFVFGANTGIAWEAYPCSFLSIVLKAQQYILFGNKDQYLKPLFSIGLRYNFHK